MADINPTMIFPTGNLLNVSTDFTVPANALGHIMIKDMPDCGYAVIEYYFGVDCDFSWEPFNWCGKQMHICYPSTNFIIPIPGRYRIVLHSDEDEHIIDPSFYSDTRIQYKLIYTTHDLSDYFAPCCFCCDE